MNWFLMSQSERFAKQPYSLTALGVLFWSCPIQNESLHLTATGFLLLNISFLEPVVH